MKSSTKIYVLDTNILMENPKSLLGFEENEVVITDVTIEELDNNKVGSSDRNRNARIASRIIKNLIQAKTKTAKSVLGADGVKINEKGGILSIRSFNQDTDEAEQRDFLLDLSKPDNKIIFSVCNIAKKLKEEKKKNECILITNDTNMFIKANALELHVQDYKNEHEKLDSDTFYTGRGTVILNDEDFEIFSEEESIPVVLKNDSDTVLIGKHESDYPCSMFIENKYFEVLREYDKPQDMKVKLAIYQKGQLKLITPKTDDVFGVKARNKGQIFALDALTKPVSEVPLVILKGPAGSAKTFLSLAAGLNDADILQYNGQYNAAYKKVMITRANVLSDRDLGALPGDKEEKMMPLVASFMDNLLQLLRKESKEYDENINIQMEDLIASGAIEIESIAYMRGRSITDTYLIVDEAQNCTRNQMLELITRVGENTKIVICGDPDQIDNPKLDKYNNGLTFVSEKMKGSELCAQMTFNTDESVRSPLAKEAAERLVLK